MTYAEKLKDPRWQKKRLDIMNRDDWKCNGCNRKDITLHVHHKEYINGRKPWEYDDDNFMTLCESCHGIIHLPFMIRSSNRIEETENYFNNVNPIWPRKWFQVVDFHKGSMNLYIREELIYKGNYDPNTFLYTYDYNLIIPFQILYDIAQYVKNEHECSIVLFPPSEEIEIFGHVMQIAELKPIIDFDYIGYNVFGGCFTFCYPVIEPIYSEPLKLNVNGKEIH